MPNSFREQMGRVHTTKPVMDSRMTDLRNFSGSVANGVGIISGFVISQQVAASKKINISRGLAVGPDGKQVTVGVDPSLSGSDYNKALVNDSALFDLSANLESLSGAYSALDPATHSILVTLDIVNERFRALKITNAEATALEAAIAAAETGNGIADFNAATGNHRARLRASLKNPDGAPAGATGIIAVTAVATEYILGVVTLAATGTVTTTAVLRRERKQKWSDMAV